MTKELINQLNAVQAGACVGFQVAKKAADALEAQQKRIDELESEIDRKMSAASYVIEQLAAAQAREKVLREALEEFLKLNDPSEFGCACDPSGHICGPCAAYKSQTVLRKALALPTDDSALREMLAAERERCAKVCDEIHSFHFVANPAELCAINIRAMEKVK